MVKDEFTGGIVLGGVIISGGGFGCDNYSIHTDVSAHISWLIENMPELETCPPPIPPGIVFELIYRNRS